VHHGQLPRGLHAVLGTLVPAEPLDDPPQPDEGHQADGDDARVVHVLSRDGQDEREAEEDDRHEDVDQGDDVDGEAQGAAHVEGARDDVPAARQDVREDSARVGQRAEHDEGGDQRLEGRRAPDIDAAQAGDHEAHGNRGTHGGVERGVDLREEGREGSRVVACKAPPHASAGDEGADERWERGQEEEAGQANCAGVGTRGLHVDVCGWEIGPAAVEDGIEVVDGVEEGNKIHECGGEGCEHLQHDALRHLVFGFRDWRTYVNTRDIYIGKGITYPLQTDD